MADVRCHPIDDWQGPFTYDLSRRRPPFKAGWATVLDDLERELDHLGASDVVIGLDLRPGEIRLDGWPKANAAPPPPVSLTMTTRVGPLRFQCDRWDTWRGNLRAIGLTLQRLRLVDEGGCTRSNEQYRGWSALPPAREAGPAMTLDHAARLLSECSLETVEHLLAAPEIVKRSYRCAVGAHHPDHGGDPAKFRELTDARDLLLRALDG